MTSSARVVRRPRFVENVRVERLGEDIVARSTFLIYRSRGDSARADLLAGERRDTLRPVNASFKLARRDVFLAQSVLGLPSLSFFF